MEYILALDQGTTSSRTLLVDQKGKIASSSQKELTQFFPNPGWVEHDPEEIFQTQLETINEVITKSKVEAKNIVGLGITNQRETVVIWEKATGNPIHKAIVWQDRRTSEFCEELKRSGPFEKIRNITGLPIDPYFSASKIKWLLDKIDGARKRAENGDLLFGTIDSWLIWKLTKGKVHATDFTNASRTMLFNIQKLEWDNELLSLFNIPATILPTVQKSSANYGFFELGECLIPIAGVAGDQQASLFGQGCLEKGDLKNTYGTGCFLLMNNGNEFSLSSHGLVTTLACSLTNEPVYAYEGSVFVAGAAIQWLRDSLEIIKSANETDEMALSVEENELVLVPAFVGLGTPYWDADARGAIFGLTRDSGRAHFAKAALQSIAFQTKDIIEAMIKDGGIKPIKLKVDGGATANKYLMQFQADILDLEINCAFNQDTTALGAAYLAGIEVGLWSLGDILKFSKSGNSWHPKMAEKSRDFLYTKWKKAVGRTLGWLKN